jgi:hypothetical protein
VGSRPATNCALSALPLPSTRKSPRNRTHTSTTSPLLKNLTIGRMMMQGVRKLRLGIARPSETRLPKHVWVWGIGDAADTCEPFKSSRCRLYVNLAFTHALGSELGMHFGREMRASHVTRPSASRMVACSTITA